MNRDELIAGILAASGPKPIPVEVEGVGTVHVRVMTAYDGEQMRKTLESLPKDDGCYVGRMMAFVLCDEQGMPLFDPSNAETVLRLSKLPPKMQQRVMQAANEATTGNA